MDKFNGQRTNHSRLSHFHACYSIFRHLFAFGMRTTQLSLVVRTDYRAIKWHGEYMPDNFCVFVSVYLVAIYGVCCVWVWQMGWLVAGSLFEPYLKSWCRHINRESPRLHRPFAFSAFISHVSSLNVLSWGTHGVFCAKSYTHTQTTATWNMQCFVSILHNP